MIYRKYSYPVTANIHKARNKFSLQFFLLEMVYHWWCSISSLTKSSSPLEVGTQNALQLKISDLWPFAKQPSCYDYYCSMDRCIKSWLIKTHLTITWLKSTPGDPRPNLLIHIVQKTFPLIPRREADQIILSKALKPLSRKSQKRSEVLWRHSTYLHPRDLCVIKLPYPHAL